MSVLESKRHEGKRHHTYAPLKESDAQEVDDDLQPRPFSRERPKRIPRLVQHFFSFSAGVILTSIFFFVFGIRSPVDPGLCAGSVRSPVPPLPLTTVTFEKNDTYMARPSIHTNQAWNRLLPPGRGFVFIDNPKQYNLQPGQSTEHGEIYSVSLFHQLHCLGQMRKAHWTLIEGVESGDTRQSKLLLGEGGAHIGHCLDYLRQSIMCAGDMSMEWPRTEPDGDRFAVDGWGIPHQCKSWDGISAYMEKAHFNNSMNVEIAPS